MKLEDVLAYNFGRWWAFGTILITAAVVSTAIVATEVRVPALIPGFIALAATCVIFAGLLMRRRVRVKAVFLAHPDWAPRRILEEARHRGRE